MRIKLDENLPASASRHLTALGHDADTVPSEGLKGRSDEPVWQAAQRGHRFFITQDLGFSDLNRFPPGEHHGILILRLGQAGRRAINRRIRELFATSDVESWERCLVVATHRKVRVRRPPA